MDAPAGHCRTFSYSIPPHLTLRPGHLVRVPFGPRTLQGIVFSFETVPQVPETRPVSTVSDPDPALTETQLRVARWISDYYMCPLFEAAAPMLPPGGRARTRTLLFLTSDDGAQAEDFPWTPAQRRVAEYIRRRGRVDLDRLVRALGESARAAVGSLQRRGIVASEEVHGRPSVGPRYLSHLRITEEGRRQRWPESSRAPRQAALLSRLLDIGGALPLSDAKREFGDGVLNGLLSKGLAVKERVPIDRDPLAGKRFPRSEVPVTLTPHQRSAADEIRAALDRPTGGPNALLLHGVTGSGKTEVYLEATARCIALGRRAIALVPEIALTHQTVERFSVRFPGRVAVLHSGLSAGERFDQWWKIRRGEFDVVIGSRGAIFAPQPDLGLVVIDEEHEWTYKQQDASPRYHTRDVALRLAELNGAVVVLGSASPDLVSYHRALAGELRLLTLPDRVRSRDGPASRSPERTPLASAPERAPLASVEVVDLRKELREGNRSIFSRPLIAAMDECLSTGGQMVLFLNRRGSAGYTQCRGCGHSLRCRRCDIALTYHRQADRLICHYCGYKRIVPARCPVCLGYRMSHRGVGTQSVVEAFGRRYPEAEILRLDRDAARSARDYDDLLSRFSSAKARALVGTQMVAKGHHFPMVSLVGVVSADLGLNIPDYRAEERAFQLLCQVAGRAGRGPLAGKVIIQTYQPENYAVQAAARQDYRAFYNEEIAHRREQANPPVSKLVRLLYSHTNRAVCEADATRLADLIKSKRDASGHSDVEVLGPTPAYPARLRGRYRWHIILRGPEPRRLLDQVAVPPKWTVDIDPVALA